MPESKKRKTHPHHHQDFIPHEQKKKSAIPYISGFFGLFGAGIGWFAIGDNSILAVLLGLIVGAGIGYYAGMQVDKTFNTKK